MTLFKFFTHPAPGFHADGSFVVQDTKTPISLATKTPSKKVVGDYGGYSSGTGTGSGTGTYGDPGSSGISFQGGNSSANVDTYNPIRDRLEEGSIVEDWIPRDASGIDEMFKLMYNRDYIAGVVVDLLAEMVWSEFDLVGIQDPVILNIYRDSMEAIDIVSVGPEIAKEFMVIGRAVSSMIFNKERGVFDDIICHDPSFLKLTPIPIKGFDPKIDLIPSPALRQFVESVDPRDMDARKILPQSYIEAVRKASGGSNKSGYSPNQNFLGQQGASGYGTSGGIPLDPINTLFLPRRTFGWDHIGTSMFTRLITFWALEKALINATMASARRRIRSILHVKAGIDNIWEPSSQEMDNIAGMFIQADEDPAGAVVVTRTGVDTNEVRSGQDFYKWADEWQLLNEGKLRALGANDALLCLSGDTLIPTIEHGIIRIDTFGDKAVDEKLTTVGSVGFDTTKKWLYSGKGKVVELKTNAGNSIKCTPDHKILVLVNNDLTCLVRQLRFERWKKAKDLKLDDYLCISKEKCTRKSALCFDLVTSKLAHFNEKILKPEGMTTDLAYIIGILASSRLMDSMETYTIVDGVRNKFLTVFGLETYNDSADIVSDYLSQLGIDTENTAKVVPWSILQADEECQISYLAACIDADGAVQENGKEIIIHSESDDVLHQTQIILNSHGVESILKGNTLLTTCNVYTFCKKLAAYSCSNKFENISEPETQEALETCASVKYTQLKGIQYLDEELDVFDIQMTNNPSFVANGIIVHNSGDATYSNQETARQFFMERVVKLRDVLTTRIFYNRLFPLTARIHGFKKRSTAELAHRIRIEANETDSVNNITQRQALSIPNNQLIVPRISWHKELVNKINMSKMELFEKLEEKGVPVKLRDWSAAGGIDLDNQLSGLESDADLRKQVANWKNSFESSDTENQEEEAKLEFIKSLKNLAHSNLKTIVGSNIVNLGPLASFIFWDSKACVGPVEAKDLGEFLSNIKPDDSSYRVVGDGLILKNRLFGFFQNNIKVEIAHYLLYRSGLTPIKPALSNVSISEISSCIKASLDQYSNHGQIYKLAKLAESELSILGQLSAKRFVTMKQEINENEKKVNKPKVKDRNLVDGLKGVDLYSGI